jgi:hypothetical protein
MKLLNFNEFVTHLNESQELLLEAFNSSILQSVVTKQREGGIDKKFFDALSKIGVAASEVTNLDITTLAPADAAKYAAANPNQILIYYSTTEKPNPYVSPDGKYYYGTIKADVPLAVVKGKLFMGLAYDRWASKGGKAEYKLVAGTDAGTSLGLGNKDSRGYGSSGINTLKKMADVSDVVYAINPDTVPSSKALKAERSESRAGAIAYKSDKEFKAENQSRYEAILRDRASNEDIDKMVGDAIDTLTQQIKDAIAKGAKTSYGDVLIGLNPKGREVKMSDAGHLMSTILRDYGTYASAKNDEIESEKRHGETDRYYRNRSAEAAKAIKDGLNKIKNLNYAW